MSTKNSNTTADHLPWEEMKALIIALFCDGDYRFSLLIACGCYLGIKISDLRVLTWGDLLKGDDLVISKQKTKQLRKIKINKELHEHIYHCWKTMGKPNMEAPCFVSRKKTLYSTQRINIRLKEIKRDYHLSIENFSTHSLRKTFGRRVLEKAKENDEIALIKLCAFFNHSSVNVTRRYLGVQSEEERHEEEYDV